MQNVARCLFLASALAAVSSCAADHAVDGAPGGDSADEAEFTGPVRYIDAVAAAVADAASCAAGNGSHRVGSYDPESFVAAPMLEAIKAEDAQRGCPGRVYSKSKQQGVANFVDFLDNNDNFIANVDDACEDPAELTSDLREIAKASTNVAVFSSLHDSDGDDDPVACAYFAFYVLLEDGTALSFDFDYSD